MFFKVKKNKGRDEKGQNLIEALLALALFFVFISGSLILIFRHFDTFLKAEELGKVQTIVSQSFEAVQGISYNSWSNLTDGTHGLSSSSGNWQFQASPDLIDNKYTRTITVSVVNRDDNCDITTSGGTDDPDTKLVTVSVAWQDVGGPRSSSLNQYFTSWNSPTNCFASGGEAASLDLDVSMAYIDSTKKSLFGVSLINKGTTPITLDKMTLNWTKPGNITFIKIDGSNHWDGSNGIGTPHGAQPSGTELDLVDLILDPGVTYLVNNIRFNSKIDGSIVTIEATMIDGSSSTKVTSPPFVP